MTRDEAKQLLPIIQAYSEGRVIQLRTSPSNWQDMEDDPGFRDPPEYYRIKPEPIECWAVVYSDNSGCLFVSKRDADARSQTSVGENRVIRMREVV